MKMVQLGLGSRFRGNERSRARLLDLEKSGEAESIFNASFAPVKRPFTIKRD